MTGTEGGKKFFGIFFPDNPFLKDDRNDERSESYA
jgi:hypothetical protein